MTSPRLKVISGLSYEKLILETKQIYTYGTTNRWLVNNQVELMWYHQGRLCVTLRNHDHSRLQVFEQFIGLLKVKRRLDRAIDCFHCEWLKRSQCLQVRKVRLRKDDGVQRIGAPKFNKMYRIAKSQTRMAAKYHTRLKINYS